MLKVFFTVDVEIWCGGWNDIDRKFPAAFQRYVYGRTVHGEYGLRHKLRQLWEHGLAAVFFVEPLFATRFGKGCLEEIIGLIQEYKQEVQLHVHPEWVDESLIPLLPNAMQKRQFLRQFSLEEQVSLIATAKRMIAEAGGGEPTAFRAGSFGFNRDTLRALARNSITFDSSYNASIMGRDSGVMPGQIVLEPIECEGVYEYPMTVFDDGTRSLRHTQLGACSSTELEGVLWQALENERKAFVILSHNFELLNMARDRRDKVAVKRMERLCQFFDRHRDCFEVRGFRGLEPETVAVQPPPLTSPAWKTGFRMAEQLLRRAYG